MFVGYKVYKEANSVKNGKPSASDYLRVFLIMSLSFLGDVLKEGLKGSAEASNKSYYQKKRKKYTTYGKIRIEGGVASKKTICGGSLFF